MPVHRLEIRDLTVAYKRVPAVHHLSLELLCGSSIGLLGPNGAGKTSLLKALVGLVPLESGSISFHGQEQQLSAIAYLPQRSAIDWDFPITVRELVEMGRYQSLGWWRPFRAGDRREECGICAGLRREDCGATDGGVERGDGWDRWE